MSVPHGLAPGVPTPGPFSALLGFRYVSLTDGVAHVEGDPGPEHCNGGGIVHGGYLSSLLDTTSGWAAHSGLPAGSAAPHVQLSVQYVRAALPGSTLVCLGRVVTAGRRIASAEAEITQDGKVIARAITSHAVVSRG
ncbi:acyl-CoA thioesterase [Marmoricola sp. OAE513]|uniref:PaaI family thioesterase n=1 Tax=Marmoricola sp. OAE513 TaxID=2817894 RepID=UPI001AE9D098